MQAEMSRSKDCTDIASPLVGVFYEAPAEGEEPFVTGGRYA